VSRYGTSLACDAETSPRLASIPNSEPSERSTVKLPMLTKSLPMVTLIRITVGLILGVLNELFPTDLSHARANLYQAEWLHFEVDLPLEYR
jgi:hypothetical protein